MYGLSFCIVVYNLEWMCLAGLNGLNEAWSWCLFQGHLQVHSEVCNWFVMLHLSMTWSVGTQCDVAGTKFGIVDYCDVRHIDQELHCTFAVLYSCCRMVATCSDFDSMAWYFKLQCIALMRSCYGLLQNDMVLHCVYNANDLMDCIAMMQVYCCLAWMNTLVMVCIDS